MSNDKINSHDADGPPVIALPLFSCGSTEVGRFLAVALDAVHGGRFNEPK